MQWCWLSVGPFISGVTITDKHWDLWVDPDTGYLVMSIHKHHHHTHSASRGHHHLYMDTTIWPVVNPLQMTMRGAVWLSASKLCKLECKMCLFVQVSLYKVFSKPIGHSIQQLVYSIFYFPAKSLESPRYQCSTRKTWVGFKAWCVLSENGVHSSHFSPAPAPCPDTRPPC